MARRKATKKKGAGFFSDLLVKAAKAAHNFVKDKKLISKGADALGYGRKKRRARKAGKGILDILGLGRRRGCGQAGGALTGENVKVIAF